MKKCFKCGETKEFTEFYKHKDMADGYLGKCKECTKKDATKTRNNRIEYYRDYDNERAKLPHRKELNKKVVSNYRENNPERYHAHTAVNNAVRDGRLKRPEYCTRCGEGDRVIHAHHHDYSKPLEVEWLCVVCHSEERGKADNERIPYRQPVLNQMELFEKQLSCV